MHHNNDNRPAPRWVAPFLAALRAGKCVREACREAGVCSSTPTHRRRTNDAFRAEWDAIPVVDGRTRRKTGPRTVRGAARIDQFLEELAHTSNVAAAAAVSGLSSGQVYALRRTDPDFARRWYIALAEGYDNLEMDLLSRLREGRLEDTDAEGNKRKFDFAVALRCLSAHRENVAREKGRRTPPATPSDGDCWLVAAGATGDWLGQDGKLACRQSGTWLFVSPSAGMRLFDSSTGQVLLYRSGWERPATPAEPSGGTTVDAEARTAISGLIAALVGAGVFPAP